MRQRDEIHLATREPHPNLTADHRGERRARQKTLDGESADRNHQLGLEQAHLGLEPPRAVVYFVP